jgi:hypothetical protein
VNQIMWWYEDVIPYLENLTKSFSDLRKIAKKYKRRYQI